MSVKLHEIMSAAHARSASLAAEVAGYLVLATADQIAGAPRCLGFSDVSLSEEGQVRIAGGTPVEDVAAERTLREMLGLLLLESSSVTPGLFRAAHKSPAAGVDALIREIEIALVPVNRAAARRALTRLHRDVERARQAGRLAPWQPPRRSPEPAARQSVPPPAAPEPAPAPRAESAPAPKEPTESIELPSVLTRDSSPPPIGAGERSWLTPDSVAVVDVEWPAQAPASDDELYTAIPVYVEELEPEAPAMAVPVVPDLEVPPSEEAPPARVAALPEPVTVPQPLVTPRPLGPSEPVARSDAHTPVLGSRLAVQAAAPLPPLEVSEPTPGVLVLVGDDATERMPRVIDEEDEAAEIARALAEVTRAFVESPDPVDGLETLDPPLAAEAAQAEAAPVAAAAAQAQVEPSEAQAAAAQGAPEAVEPSAAPEPELPEPEASPVRSLAELSPLPASPALELAELSPLPASPVPSLAELSPLPASPVPSLAELSPLPVVVSPQAALEKLATLPARPARHDYAPPRYAPRKSDVEELLSGFGVAQLKTERELCSDLKALAGVDQTAPPPAVELSETPPPVAVSEVGEGLAAAARPSDASSARVVAGAVSAALIIAGVGLGSIPTRTPGADGAAAAPRIESAIDSESVPPCSAELTVRQVPPSSRTRLRTGTDERVLAPSRVVGSDAVFEGLECRQGAELTVELPGRARWVRIPVAAEALSPSAEAPGLVRYTVALR